MQRGALLIFYKDVGVAITRSHRNRALDNIDRSSASVEVN